MVLDDIPIWGLLLATIGLVSLALEAGFRLGRRRQLQAGGKSEVSGAMAGTTMALLAFMLAFTFNGAAGRHEGRKALVVDEANAIDKAWLRAGLLSEPYRSDIRALLRNYVDLRVEGAAGRIDLGEGIRQSEALQQRMWALAEEVAKKDTASRTTGLFIQSLNDVIDLHLKRVTLGIHNRIPVTIWAALYLLMTLGMGMMGFQVGTSGARSIGMELALALAFSVVLFVMTDLDRPQEGLIRVSQQAMEELQARLKAR
jgi:hypothetical protein